MHVVIPLRQVDDIQSCIDQGERITNGAIGHCTWRNASLESVGTTYQLTLPAARGETLEARDATLR